MNIAGGLSGLKAAADMTRMLRDGLKAGTVKPDEIAGRIGEIYDYIIDSKDALVDAKDEIESLKGDLAHVKTEQKLTLSLEHDGHVYWIAKGDKWDGPFCPRCWDADKKLIRLRHDGRSINAAKVCFWCNVHGEGYDTNPRPLLIADSPYYRS